jgi:hypothetical protein
MASTRVNHPLKPAKGESIAHLISTLNQWLRFLGQQFGLIGMCEADLAVTEHPGQVRLHEVPLVLCQEFRLATCGVHDNNRS